MAPFHDRHSPPHPPSHTETDSLRPQRTCHSALLARRRTRDVDDPASGMERIGAQDGVGCELCGSHDSGQSCRFFFLAVFWKPLPRCSCAASELSDSADMPYAQTQLLKIFWESEIRTILRDALLSRAASEWILDSLWTICRVSARFFL